MISNYVIVEREGKPTETSGGLLLAETNIAASNWVRILALPTKIDGKRKKLEARVGQLAFLRPSDGDKFEFNPQIQKCKYSDLQAVLVDNVIKPINNKILIKKPHKQESPFGFKIIIPETSRKRLACDSDNDRGRIVAKPRSFKDAKQGQLIYFTSNESATIKDPTSGEEFLLVDVDNVLGVET
jgi:co-chaperonin GroES (HSP10)